MIDESTTSASRSGEFFKEAYVLVEFGIAGMVAFLALIATASGLQNLGVKMFLSLCSHMNLLHGIFSHPCFIEVPRIASCLLH